MTTAPNDFAPRPGMTGSEIDDTVAALDDEARGLRRFLADREPTVFSRVGRSWDQLHRQLGAEYTDMKEFAREVRKQLRRVKALWPSLNYTTPRGRLVLHPSVPSIPKLRG